VDNIFAYFTRRGDDHIERPSSDALSRSTLVSDSTMKRWKKIWKSNPIWRPSHTWVRGEAHRIFTDDAEWDELKLSLIMFTQRRKLNGSLFIDILGGLGKIRFPFITNK
jgi:hypothetical protein